MNQGLVVAASYATLAAFVLALVIVLLARELVDPDDPAPPDPPAGHGAGYPRRPPSNRPFVGPRPVAVVHARA